MSLASATLRKLRPVSNIFVRAMSQDGKAGSIREGGGAFGTREKAQEDQYFRKQAQEQLKNIKGHMDEEISHHEEEIKRHQERVKKLKEKSKDLEKQSK